jgi:hypothetical protein
MAQARKSERTERQTNIAENYIVMPGDKQQVDDDAPQPKSDNIRTNSWLKRDDEARANLHYSKGGILKITQPFTTTAAFHFTRPDNF